MAAVDVILLAVLAASVVLGWWRGLLYEVLSVLAWVAAFVVAQRWALEAAAWLPSSAEWSDPLRYATGFAVLFVATAFAGGLAAWLVRQGTQAVGLRPIDRVLGGVFGVLRGVLLLMAATLLVQLTPWVDSPAWREAWGPRWLGQGLQAVKVLVPAPVAVYFP
ncbi:Colicin V production protein [Tepidimonas fonticaldi]|uniref:Colicin V production protein n=1 Tax=Tepidimonas fonticaldi TaxID=1101373 RepID=A0A554XQF7_9BURK|nr:CvpA family protein [Tepidimonas fonticaldi]TSE38045.1 Colicin V production protein [Tepidimonas fonticaldi]